MDADETVGKRLAELRKRAGHRQEDFLALLETRGLQWTQTILSRVESGKRPMKLTEGFAIADALGIDADELGPKRSGLHYEIESLALKQLDLRNAISHSLNRLREVNDGIAALCLAQELELGHTEFEIQGSALRFAELLSVWMPGGTGSPNSTNFVHGLERIGVTYTGDPDQVRQYQITENDPVDVFEESRAALVADLVTRRFPLLSFTAHDSFNYAADTPPPFRVVGLTEFIDDPKRSLNGSNNGR